MGRIQLFNTVITGFLAYSFSMYKCPISLFNQVEQWCQNFIWTGDILKKGIVTVNQDMICYPLENEGLKIINLHHENNAYLLKLALHDTKCYDWNIPLSLQQFLIEVSSKKLARTRNQAPNNVTSSKLQRPEFEPKSFQ